MDIGTRIDNLTTITQVYMVDFSIYLVLLFMLVIVFMKTKEFILGEMVKDVEVSLNRSATLPFTMKEKVFMVM